MDRLARVSPNQRAGMAERHLLRPTVLVNAVAPAIAFMVLTSNGFSEVTALGIAAFFPAVGTLFTWLRTRQVDILGVLSLSLITVTVAVSAATNNPLFLLLRGSAIGGTIAAVCFGSLLLPRPVIFYVARYFGTEGDTAQADRFDELWRLPRFRNAMRLMTLVWGVGLAAEALTRVWLVSVLPIPAFLVAYKLMGGSVTFVLIAWSIPYVRRVTKVDAERVASEV